MRIFDTLDAGRPTGLSAEDERYIVRRALVRGAELGKLDAAMVGVLLRLIPGDDRLHGEHLKLTEHRAIRAALQANPDLSNRQLASEQHISRDTVARIRAELLEELLPARAQTSMPPGMSPEEILDAFNRLTLSDD